jgi:hypothetical protein
MTSDMPKDEGDSRIYAYPHAHDTKEQEVRYEKDRGNH